MTDLSWEQRKAQMLADREKVKAGEIYPGTIREIEETTAGRAFAGKDGRNVVKNPDRKVLIVTVEIADGDTFHEAFSLPNGSKSWANPKFKMNGFVKKYGDLPSVGQNVQVVIDSDGFYRISC